MDDGRGFKTADECLAGMGYATGVGGLVWRYRKYLEDRQDLSLQWRPAPAESTDVAGERAVHPGGHFLLEVGSSGAGRLVHVWPGWGRRTIGTGSPDQLRADALTLLRAGGPFGGPTSARTGERVVQLTGLHGGMRRPLFDGSEVRLLQLEETSLRVRIWPDGKFAHEPASGPLEDGSRMIEDDAEHILIGSTPMPWHFIDLHPLLGTRSVDAYHLLLCPLKAELVAMIAVQSGGYGMWAGRWEDIRALDVMPWLERLTAGLAQANAKAAAGAAPAEGKAADSTATAPPAADQAGPRGEPSGDKPAPKRRKPVATSPGGTPGRRERRVRLKPALAEAITRHLAGVAAGLPSGVLGAAFAVEMLRAIEAAVLSDQPTWTGKTLELFGRLHKKGYLSAIPADQAGRAALKLLADRTPLVRRLHYRRWCLAFGDIRDIHDPASALRVRLGAIAG